MSFIFRERAPHWLREGYMERYYDYRNFSDDAIPNIDAFDRNNVDDILKFIT